MNYKAHHLLVGPIDKLVTGQGQYGPYAYGQMTINPPKGRIEVIEVRFPENFDHSQIREGDVWQFVIDVRPRREGDGMTGISRYVNNDGDYKKLNRKLGPNELPGYTAPKVA